MQRIISWIQTNDAKIFSLINLKWHSRLGDLLMSIITHVGGATFTISLLVILLIFSSGNMQNWALEALFSLIISHILVQLIKKKIPRPRPYLSFPQARIIAHPLKDFSFPSGHTTASFSVAVVFALHSLALAVLFLPLACIVGLSRIYLGHHYFTDVVIGALLGTATSIVIVLINA